MGRGIFKTINCFYEGSILYNLSFSPKGIKGDRGLPGNPGDKGDKVYLLLFTVICLTYIIIFNHYYLYWQGHPGPPGHPGPAGLMGSPVSGYFRLVCMYLYSWSKYIKWGSFVWICFLFLSTSTDTVSFLLQGNDGQPGPPGPPGPPGEKVRLLSVYSPALRKLITHVSLLYKAPPSSM